MAHTFEYDGITVEYTPAIVKTRMKRGRILQKLMQSFGYVIENPGAGQQIVSDGEFEDMTEFAEHLAQTHAPGAAWWLDDNADAGALCEAYMAFCASDGALLDQLRTARRAVQPPKKTSTNTSAT